MNPAFWVLGVGFLEFTGCIDFMGFQAYSVLKKILDVGFQGVEDLEGS